MTLLQSQIRDSVDAVVSELLRTDDWKNYVGQTSEQLIQQMRTQFHVEFVELCASGTAALEIALRAMKVGSEAEVLLSGYDYPGNFWAIERCGARPVLVDVVANQWTIEPRAIEQAYSPNCRALIVSHLHGQLQAIEDIKNWCLERQVMLVEDACQAIGAQIGSKVAGVGGDVGIVSFGGGKVISSGRGGAVITNDAELAQRIRIAAGAGSGPYALSQLQAALVLAQLPYLNAFNEHNRAYFLELQTILAQMQAPLCAPARQHLDSAGIYQYGWIVKPIEFSIDRSNSGEVPESGQIRELVQRLRGLEIHAGHGFPGFHRRSARRCRIAHPLQNTSDVAARTLVLHHSQAFETNWPATRLAETIVQTLANVDIR